ncbi:MAG: hypothetical protein HN879_09655, partial [Flavobacteriaceae bacterium]|nr:hypothetical protein [Flavobacteriaceae bacterium]
MKSFCIASYFIFILSVTSNIVQFYRIFLKDGEPCLYNYRVIVLVIGLEDWFGGLVWRIVVEDWFGGLLWRIGL